MRRKLLTEGKIKMLLDHIKILDHVERSCHHERKNRTFSQKNWASSKNDSKSTFTQNSIREYSKDFLNKGLLK